MANVKISELTAISSVSDADLFEVSDDNGAGGFNSRKATGTQVRSYALGNAFISFTGPTTSTKTFTLPNASATVHTSGGQGDGTASAPAYSFSADTNTGIYRITADTLGFSTAGSEWMRIAADGRVAVGTTSPATNSTLTTKTFLGAYGAAATFVSDNNTSNWARADWVNVNAAQPGIVFLDQTGNFVWRNDNTTGQTFAVYQGSTARLVVDDAGRVGIPTAVSGTQVYITSASGTSVATAEATGTSTAAVTPFASNASYASTMVYIAANRAATTAYNFLQSVSSNSGTPDTEFLLRGDGTGLCDGSWTGGGADYAEYFEWADGNPADEDRRGYSVVLDGAKIRKALPTDPASAIIGVVSAQPSVVGDAAWNKWSGKYLTDDFGSYLMEDYEAWSWTETVNETDPVTGTETSKDVQHSCAADAVPEGVVVPDDKTVVVQQRRKLNPQFDPTMPYTPREERPEWSAIGLMGKLRILKGQPTGDRWIKMRDVSDAVEEWLVR